MRRPRDPAERTGVPVPPPLFYAAGIATGWLLGRWAPLPLPGGSFVPVVAALWIAFGTGVAVWGLVSFRRARTTFNPFGGTSAIVANGPYAYTRNPMYLGLACVQVGAGLALREGWILLLLIPVLVLVDRLVIRREERYLERKYGEHWAAYAQKVRRWI